MENMIIRVFEGCEIEIVVPKNYNQGKYVWYFINECLRKPFHRYQNWGFCGANGTAYWDNWVNRINPLDSTGFGSDTDKLIPGNKYIVRFYQSRVDNPRREDIVASLKEQGALFPGMPGLLLAYELTNGRIAEKMDEFLDRTLSFHETSSKISTIERWVGNHEHIVYQADEVQKSDLILCFTES